VVDLSTVSRKSLRDDTMLQHPIFLYQICAQRVSVDDSEEVVEEWITDRVYATAEEADAYGRSNVHNTPDGWRVWSVPAAGALRELLEKAMAP
jgi:hypothetical protein